MSGIEVLGAVSAAWSLSQSALTLAGKARNLCKRWRTMTSQLAKLEAHMEDIQIDADLAVRILEDIHIDDDTDLETLLNRNTLLVAACAEDLDSIYTAGQAKRFGKQKAFFKILGRETSIRELLKELRRNQKHIQNRLNHLSRRTTQNIHQQVYRMDEQARETNLSLVSLADGQAELTKIVQRLEESSVSGDGYQRERSRNAYEEGGMLSQRDLDDRKLQKQRRVANIALGITAVLAVGTWRFLKR